MGGHMEWGSGDKDGWIGNLIGQCSTSNGKAMISCDLIPSLEEVSKHVEVGLLTVVDIPHSPRQLRPVLVHNS